MANLFIYWLEYNIFKGTFEFDSTYGVSRDLKYSLK